ncbi:uncharacterized protein STEHIDRAFT_182876 [Stereum hirsutum FP-91666 SS1]|uniref:uncharacterized protein n=1 Tax=Stereum hirsutum (strain FP-91666) TaxID=721885 RepID=UPI000444A283|nr:uncharacterized protein STEHIDRAFT_182876 [Stereum hirsutum FP-91666 SS1]EIM83160.1 hypothetical protein STEHIDRAFT_182876 [Stereum hirsutum FP-91666 SS1]
MFTTRFIAFATLAAFAVVNVQAESHTITFANYCGYGTPTLVSQSGQILSTGGAYNAGGPIIGAIAYLQTGGCGLNGDYCTTVETTLKNGVGASSTDITLIPDHEFNVAAGFGYYNGCDNTGADCTYYGCPTAFYVPTDTHVQVGCSTDNVDLTITFCH